MDVTHRTENNVDILALDGRFDAYEVPAIAQWLEAHPEAKNVIVNLSGVGFIDSSGLATLVKALKHCRQNKGELYITNLQQAVRIIIELTRLDKAFTILDDEATALKEIQNGTDRS